MTLLEQRSPVAGYGRAGRITGYCFLSSGLLMLVIAAVVGLGTARWSASLVRVRGEVVAIQRTGSTARALVEARSPDGSTIRVLGTVSTLPWPVLGSAREVGYPAGRPGEAAVLDPFLIWFAPGSFGFLGLMFTGVGSLIRIFGAPVGGKIDRDSWMRDDRTIDATANEGPTIGRYDDSGHAP